MVRTQASTHIARPPDQVFAFVALDFFSNYQRWSPEVVSLEALSPGPIRLGSRGRQVRVDHGRRTEATFEVCVFEQDRRIDFQGLSAPIYISYRFEPSADGTRLTFVFELSRLELFMRPFEKLIRAAIQEGGERVVGNIRGLLEQAPTAVSQH
ncbi:MULTISPECIES: SRPBCC family protein [Marichromatium]|uniref:Polyketide cyclase/dehydrase/lipid transport protein n=1 Tax=Marichromatium gracile TaxID=1048 RepID=A0A4R4AED7_MARGR|nr:MULTISPECIES: SRPBCC family protein [Marichromatium]MBO8087587.1 SRPBCC family protein [Marichromatium sp.]MBK1709753.1 polyketide cyclase [Marichromatium gracile]RNE91454.1 polyketide cyclase [Marichromatium sp. AB31]RNE92834.1 polyketide cyclase [Marichromatium sp. AB32]TCW37079.1 polyketide cyclase/dehydrase/lipid transport protein [Marichromatium gracile]